MWSSRPFFRRLWSRLARWKLPFWLHRWYSALSQPFVKCILWERFRYSSLFHTDRRGAALWSTRLQYSNSSWSWPAVASLFSPFLLFIGPVTLRLGSSRRATSSRHSARPPFDCRLLSLRLACRCRSRSCWISRYVGTKHANTSTRDFSPFHCLCCCWVERRGLITACPGANRNRNCTRYPQARISLRYCGRSPGWSAARSFLSGASGSLCCRRRRGASDIRRSPIRFQQTSSPRSASPPSNS